MTTTLDHHSSHKSEPCSHRSISSFGTYLQQRASIRAAFSNTSTSTNTPTYSPPQRPPMTCCESKQCSCTLLPSSWHSSTSPHLHWTLHHLHPRPLRWCSPSHHWRHHTLSAAAPLSLPRGMQVIQSLIVLLWGPRSGTVTCTCTSNTAAQTSWFKCAPRLLFFVHE